MSRLGTIFLLGSLFLASISVGFAQSDPPLLHQSSLVYQGAFRLPDGDFGDPAGRGFHYGALSIAYNPANNSLFVGNYSSLLAEVAVPAIVNGTLNSLNTGTVLQQLRDPFEGKINQFAPTATNSINLSGQLVYNGKLYLTATTYYESGGVQTKSHFVRPLNLLTTGQVQGPFMVGSLPPEFVSGYMTPVPAASQTAVGGPVLTGQCCIAVISRSSYGPSVSSFDPASLGSVNPIPATPLVYYPDAHQTLGSYDSNGQLYNGNTRVAGVVYPTGTRTVLFIGRRGAGPRCYGNGTSDSSLAGTTDQNGVPYCYDPVDNSHGVHGYPYTYQMMAYDVNDLISVKTGSKQPWDIVPYDHWDFELPLQDPNHVVDTSGVTYDPAGQRIFISQDYGDGTLPLIHIFRVQVENVPSPPANLRKR